jgi:transcriptional regulator with XRE-family HTH domain
VPALIRNALVRLLAERGWTDAELAARAGLDRAYVNQVKNGRALPTVATALALARALGAPVATVFPPGSTARRLRPARRATRDSVSGRRGERG